LSWGSEKWVIGAVKLVYQCGIVPENISQGIAAALLFEGEEDKEAKKLTQMRKKEGIDAILRKVCQIDPEGRLASLIKKSLKELSK